MDKAPELRPRKHGYGLNENKKTPRPIPKKPVLSKYPPTNTDLFMLIQKGITDIIEEIAKRLK